MDGLVTEAQSSDVPPEAQPQEALAAPGAPPQEEEVALEAGEEAATPEEQEAYDSAIAMAAEMLYVDEQASDKFLDMMTDGDSIEAPAEVIVHVMDMIEETFQGQLPEAMILPIADEVSDMVIELGVEAGAIAAPTEDEAVKIKVAVLKDLAETYGVEEEDFIGAIQGTTDADMAEAQRIFGGA